MIDRGSASVEEREFLLPAEASSSSSPSPGGHQSGEDDDNSLTEEETDDMASNPPLLGKIRAYWLGVVVCMGGFLYGYDSGIIGGVLTLPSFEADYRYGKSSANHVQSFAVSLQQLGGFVACFFIWPLVHKIGRRPSLMICSFVFCVGVVIQTVNTHSTSAFYVARVIAGLGLGGATVVIPMYNSEMVPKELRGQIGCFFQLMYTIGILISYWVDYGVKLHVSSTASKQWQIPIALQLVPGGLVGLGAITLKESVRWYAYKGRMDDAWKSLTWIRASDGPEVRREMEEIRLGVEQEAHERANFSVNELFAPLNMKLFSTAFLMFLAQQSTGATAFAYYAPQYFKLIVGGGNKDLLLTGIFGAVKVVACALFVFLLSERLGRKISLVTGAILMSFTMFITAAIVATHPPPSSADADASSHVSASGKATVAMIYLFVIIYNGTWGPLPWPYVAEIFPTRIREIGVGIGVSSQWLFAFVYTLVTPYMISNIGYGTFIFWGATNVVIAIGSLFLKETKRKSLEQINAEFDGRGEVLGAPKDADQLGRVRQDSPSASSRSRGDDAKAAPETAVYNA